MYNRQEGINWQHDADGRLVDGNDHYAYDAAGRNNYLETSALTTATMSFDGDDRQIKTVETWVDENFETQSDTKYYVRSTVLGGQLMAEVDPWGQLFRTFVYAGPAVLGWLWHSYSGETMVWEQRDPSGATVRGIGEQELDPLGADAGTAAFSVPPTDRALISYGTSYDPANPDMTYSVDGIRMPVEDFLQHAGFILKDPLGLLEWLARKNSIPVGFRNKGVRWGERFEVIYDANGKMVSQKWEYDPNLAGVSFGSESPIYSAGGLPDLGILRQSKLALPADLEDRVRLIVTNPKSNCGQFITNLIGAVKGGRAYSQDPVNLFTRVQREGRIRLKRMKYSGLAPIEGNKRVIYVKPVDATGNERTDNHSLNGYAVTVLNELMHHAAESGVYSDRTLAEAIFTLLTPEEREQHPLPRSKGYKANSTYFHSLFNKNCPSITGE
jgi:hypothetical protein